MIKINDIQVNSLSQFATIRKDFPFSLVHGEVCPKVQNHARLLAWHADYNIKAEEITALLTPKKCFDFNQRRSK